MQILSFCNYHVASSPVTNFVVETHDDTTIVISWSPPGRPGGEVTSYSVMLQDLKTNEIQTDSIMGNSFVTSALGKCSYENGVQQL